MFEVSISAVKVQQTMLNEIVIEINGHEQVWIVPKEKFKKYFNKSNKINEKYLTRCNWFLFQEPKTDYYILKNPCYIFQPDEYFSFYFDVEEEAFYFKMKYG